MGLRLAAVALLTLLARAAPAADPIYVPSSAPFADPPLEAREEVAECGLPRNQIQVLLDSAMRSTVRLIVDDAAAAARRGTVLEIEIAGVVNGGIPLFQHKEVAVNARLLSHGEEIASFYGVRTARGGWFRSSCTLLQHCQETLGKDLARWLSRPTRGVQVLGE